MFTFAYFDCQSDAVS